MTELKFNEDLAALFGYLAADGYVIRNPPEQIHKYYVMGLRNQNYTLLKDFQNRFYSYFGKKPHLRRAERCVLTSKDIYYRLTDGFSFYSADWNMPDFKNRKLSASWLRAYYDCDGSVYCMKAKNRKISLESINYDGILSIKNLLKEHFAIESKVNKRTGRNTWTIDIFGKNNLIRFRKDIGFLHPKKRAKLDEAINSYVNYIWDVPSENDIVRFVRKHGNINKLRGIIILNSIVKDNLEKVRKALIDLGIKSKVYGPWRNAHSTYYCIAISLKDWNNYVN